MKKLILAMLCIASMTLTSCNVGNLSIDGLLVAPKLTTEQQKIHETLIQSVGKGITLKYPKNGNNRSAFVIANIDDEPTNEALVLYEHDNLSLDSGGIRISVLDQNSNGEWTSRHDIAGAGTDVDQILISKLGGNQINIIVGYATMDLNEKVLEIYSYADGKLNRIFEDKYNVLETIDIDNDGSNELITVQNNPTDSTSTVSLLSYQDSGIQKVNTIRMSDGTTSVLKYLKGKVLPTHKALFIDCHKSTNDVQTEIVFYRYSSLQNPMAQIGEELSLKTSRPSGYYCSDVDGDGIIEIPTVKPLPGYEDKQPEEQLYLTTWSVYEDYYSLKEKYTGYYSIANGYNFVFPEKWENKITVVKDTANNEAVFYKYDGKLDGNMSEIMRIGVSVRSETKNYTDEGYQVIRSIGQVDFVVKLSGDIRDELSLQLSDVKRNFYVIS